MTLLQVSNLTVDYGAVRALRGITLEVGDGEIVALLGANGAGKTTTLRAISGMTPSAGGDILLEGKHIGALSAHQVVRLGVAHLPEGRELFRSLTVEENLRYGIWTRRKERDLYQENLERVFSYFPRLKERSSQMASTLSGGEQQMLGIARALMSSPRLLLVDELSLGLAPMIVAQLFEILDEINKAGTSVLLVEQFVHMALQHSRRAYVLGKGEVVVEGESFDLLESPDLIASYLGESVEHASEDRPEAADLALTLGSSDEGSSRLGSGDRRRRVGNKAGRTRGSKQ